MNVKVYGKVFRLYKTPNAVPEVQGLTIVRGLVFDDKTAWYWNAYYANHEAVCEEVFASEDAEFITLFSHEIEK